MLFFTTSKFPANKNLSGRRGLRRVGVVACLIPSGAMEMCLPSYACVSPCTWRLCNGLMPLLFGPKDVLKFVSFELLLNRSRPNPFRAEEV